LEKYAKEDIENPKKMKIAKNNGRILEIIYVYVKDAMKHSN